MGNAATQTVTDKVKALVLDEAERIKRLETAPLGGTFNRDDLQSDYGSVYGGVSWPKARPGFAVVIAMDKDRHFGNHDIYLLDEFESPDIRELVRQCGALDCKYQPVLWVGDNLHNTADQFIKEMNRDFSGRRNFRLDTTPILDMKHPFEYILPELKRLLHKDRRQLFLKNSKVRDYLATIEQEEIPKLEFGDYPAIESVGLAVIELRDRAGNPPMTKQQWRELKKKHE